MTSEQLVVVVAAIFAVLFAYIPGLASWYEPLDATRKRLIMLGLMVVVVAAVFGLSCANILTNVTCDKAGVMTLLNALIYAIIANQGTYMILPKEGLNK